MHMNRHTGAAVALLLGFALLGHGGVAQAQVKKAEILAQIQQAFQKWEDITCSKLRFEYAGEVSPFVSEKPGAIIVYFGYNNATWRFSNPQSNVIYAYSAGARVGINAEGNITSGEIAMNARDIDWSIGAAADSFDIQTAVLHLIAPAVGLYAGSRYPDLGYFMRYNYENRSLTPEEQTGAQYTYPEGTTMCARPSAPPTCQPGWVPAGGGAADAGGHDGSVSDGSSGGGPFGLCIVGPQAPYHWVEPPVKYYVFIPDEGKLPGSNKRNADGAVIGGDKKVTDASTPTACASKEECKEGQVCSDQGICVAGGDEGNDDDDGCCRVSHGRRESTSAALLLLVGLGLLLWRRRRR